MKISAIGLNWISISSIMAFSRADQSMQLFGWDPDVEMRVAADRKKVFNKISKTLKNAAKETKILFLGLDGRKRTSIFKELAMRVQHGSVVVNLIPPYYSTIALFRELLNNRANLISIYPAVQTKFLMENDQHIDSAREDLFQGCPHYIADDGHMDSAILDLAVDIVVLMGGYPVFISPEELDGLISSTCIFPKLISTELMKTIAELPGWSEGSETANVDLFQTTLPVQPDLDALNLAQITDDYRENLILILDIYLRSLVELRKKMDERETEPIAERILQSIRLRRDWLDGRSRSEAQHRISASIPSTTEALKRIKRLDQ